MNFKTNALKKITDRSVGHAGVNRSHFSAYSRLNLASKIVGNLEHKPTRNLELQETVSCQSSTPPSELTT